MRVLIAEDALVSRRLLESTLTRWGYEVMLATNGIEAWEILQRPDAPQLAILDWMMPGMDGLQVCRRVRGREAAAYTYIILLTARGHKEDIAEGMVAGADDYLTKPFDAQELKARLHAGRRILDLQARLFDALETLREQATHDSLTCLWNHSAILDILRREMDRARQESAPITVILADLDHFKRVNDTHGHQAGDTVLHEVSRRLRATTRPRDQIGRYGGEEFMIVLPGCDDAAAADLAEALRLCVAREAVPIDGGLLPVTLSLGLAVGTGDTLLDPAEFVRAADVALYRAKDGGRNRVEKAAL